MHGLDASCGEYQTACAAFLPVVRPGDGHSEKHGFADRPQVRGLYESFRVMF